MRIGTGLLAALATCLALPAFAQSAGEIVSVVGKGEYRAPTARDWEPARARQGVEGGSFVRTLVNDAKMSVLLADRTQLTLQGIAMAQVKHPEEAKAGKSIVDMVKGKARFQTKTPTAGFAVGTPTGLAAIRGTEWLMEVDDNLAVVTVVEGEVEVSNALGKVSVLPDEQAVLERGKAPVKRRIQDARSRVQWVSAFVVETARYPELRSPAADAEGASLAAIARAVDAGDLTRARELARGHVAGDGLKLATGHFLAADLALWFGEAGEAIALLDTAGKRFPAEPRTPAFIAQAALYADRFDLAREAAARAVANAPGSIESQLAAGEVARLDGDYFGARRAFREATRIAPGDWRGWHGLARVEGEHGNYEASRAAFEKSLATTRRRGIVLGDRGTMEAAAGELEASRATLQAALEAQPDDYTTWAGLGLARLKSGDTDGAIDALTRATMLEPRYSVAHASLAVAYWQRGLVPQAMATLERASLADPRDPLPYQLAAMMRSDLLQPGLAVEQALESLARQKYAKRLDAVTGGVRGVANLGAAFAQFGLEQWALRSAQESYDPLWAGSHFFLADRYASKYSRNGELLQGFLTDPMALGAPNRFQGLVPRDGGYATLRWSGARDPDNRLVEPVLTLNGMGAEGRIAGFADFGQSRQWKVEGNDLDEASSATFALGFAPRHDLGFFVYGNRVIPEVRRGDESPRTDWSVLDGSARRIDGGLSWRPTADSAIWLKGGNGSEDSRLRTNTTRTGPPNATLYAQGQEFTTQPRRGDVQARGLLRLEGGHELTGGFEGATWNSIDFLERDALFVQPGQRAPKESVRQDIRDESQSIWLAGRARFGPAAIDLYVDRTNYEKTNDILVRRDLGNQQVPLTDPHSRDRTSGRAGIAVRPVEPLTVRLAWQEWLRPASTASLSPTATAGIPLDDRYVLAGGLLKRARGQLEWEATDRLLFTAYADRQEIDNLYSPLIGVLNNRPDSSNLERLRNRSFNNLATLDQLEGYPDLSRGKLNEAGGAVNAVLSRHLSVYAEATRADSENTLAYPGKLLAYMPRNRAALGATFFTDWRMSIGAKAVYRSERFKDEANTAANRLEGGWDGSVQAYWETADKRWSFEVLVSRIGAKGVDESVAIAVNAKF